MVYKLHPGDIIGARLRWQRADRTAANKFIAIFFFTLYISQAAWIPVCHMTHTQLKIQSPFLFTFIVL